MLSAPICSISCPSPSASTLPHLSTTRRMCPLTILMLPLWTNTTLSLVILSLCDWPTERTTCPDSSPQRASQNGEPSICFASSTNFTRQVTPFESGRNFLTSVVFGFFFFGGGLSLDTLTSLGYHPSVLS